MSAQDGLHACSAVTSAGGEVFVWYGEKAFMLAGLAAVQPLTYRVVNALRACLQDASVFWRCARACACMHASHPLDTVLHASWRYTDTGQLACSAAGTNTVLWLASWRRVRVEAAMALARTAGQATNWTGLDHLLKFYRAQVCE
jgi:hypothetical protein